MGQEKMITEETSLTAISISSLLIPNLFPTKSVIISLKLINFVQTYMYVTQIIFSFLTYKQTMIKPVLAANSVINKASEDYSKDLFCFENNLGTNRNKRRR